MRAARIFQGVAARSLHVTAFRRAACALHRAHAHVGTRGVRTATAAVQGFADHVSAVESEASVKVLCGHGSVEKVGDVAGDFPQRICVLTSHSGAERCAILIHFLQRHGFHCLSFPLPPGPPTVSSLDLAERFARRAGCEAVAGFGGGSVIDTARILAMKLGNPSVNISDYMKVVGGGGATEASAPLLVVPTCPGSGTEAVRLAYLSFEEELMLPVAATHDSKQVVVADPQLMESLPEGTMAAMGVATLMNLIETYVSPNATAETQALSLAGIPLVMDNIMGATKGDADARARVQEASLLASAALVTAPAGACQGLALGTIAKYDLLYASAAAAVAPYTLEATIETLEEQDDDAGDAALAKYQRVAEALGAGATAPDDVTETVKRLVTDLNIPPLDDHDFSDADFVAIATAAEVLDSTQANPATLSRDQLVDILTNS